MEEIDLYMSQKTITVYDKKRLENLYFNARYCNKVVYTGKFFELSFLDNKGRKNTEVTFKIPIMKLNEEKIQRLMHLIHHHHKKVTNKK